MLLEASCTGFRDLYRDMTKPINVLTGLDYWLDNLMCNVPEMAMCYHLNGIVQVCFTFITSRKRSFGKVMLSQVSVCSQGDTFGR